MKKATTIAKAANFAAADFGKMSELGNYVMQLGPDARIPGKVFGGATVGTTGAEFSFQIFEPGSESGFLHVHHSHEELYFFIKGNGEYQVDGQTIAVTEGSVVRVSPAGRRTVRNTGSTPLVMLCVQYRADTFGPADAADGEILTDKVQW